jgi:hypothetical protein
VILTVWENVADENSNNTAAAIKKTLKDSLSMINPLS